MKRILSVAMACLAIAACSAPAAGCSTTSGGTPAISPLADEKALFVAESAFKGALLTVDAAVDSGQLKGENARQVSKHLADAKAALEVARTAYRAGDAIGAMTAADKATASLGAIAPLTTPSP